MRKRKAYGSIPSNVSSSMGCGRLVGSERTVGVGGLMGGELFFLAKKTDMYMYKKEWEVNGG